MSLWGEAREPGQEFYLKLWQQQYVDVNQSTMSIQVYWTELDIAEHGSILNGKDVQEGTVKDGIEPWGKSRTQRLPDLKELGYPLVRTARGRCFEIFARLVLKAEGANVSLRWELAPPNSQPYDRRYALMHLQRDHLLTRQCRER